jgi:hypothetical protein
MAPTVFRPRADAISARRRKAECGPDDVARRVDPGAVGLRSLERTDSCENTPGRCPAGNGQRGPSYYERSSRSVVTSARFVVEWRFPPFRGFRLPPALQLSSSESSTSRRKPDCPLVAERAEGDGRGERDDEQVDREHHVGVWIPLVVVVDTRRASRQRRRASVLLVR